MNMFVKYSKVILGIICVLSVVGIVMFFLPNFVFNSQYIDSSKFLTGIDIFNGMFDLGIDLDKVRLQTNEENVALIGFFVNGDGASYCTISYIISILMLLNVVSLVACIVLAILKIIGVNINFSILSKTALLAFSIQIIVFALSIVRFGQINGDSGALHFNYIFFISFAISIIVFALAFILDYGNTPESDNNEEDVEIGDSIKNEEQLAGNLSEISKDEEVSSI